jgi:DinB superfamily
MPTPSFSIPYAIERLALQATVIQALVTGVADEQARWKPTPEEWSVLEVVNHLYDEERDDFRMRFDLTLHQPEADWPPIDPPQWAIDRQYNARDFAQSVGNFLAERERSLAWLRDLGVVDLHSAHHHAQFGSMEAGVLLASWVAHDLLHIRQINEVHYRYTTQVARPFSVEYAGDW